MLYEQVTEHKTQIWSYKIFFHSIEKNLLISHLDVFFFYYSIMHGKWYLKSHNPLLKALVSFYSSGANAICHERRVTFLNVSSNKQGRIVVLGNFEAQNFQLGTVVKKERIKTTEGTPNPASIVHY